MTGLWGTVWPCRLPLGVAVGAGGPIPPVAAGSRDVSWERIKNTPGRSGGVRLLTAEDPRLGPRLAVGHGWAVRFSCQHRSEPGEHGFLVAGHVVSVEVEPL